MTARSRISAAAGWPWSAKNAAAFPVGLRPSVRLRGAGQHGGQAQLRQAFAQGEDLLREVEVAAAGHAAQKFRVARGGGPRQRAAHQNTERRAPGVALILSPWKPLRPMAGKSQHHSLSSVPKRNFFGKPYYNTALPE